MVYNVIQGGRQVEIGDGGMVKNPQGSTNGFGRFRISVPRSFIKEGAKLTLTCTIPWKNDATGQLNDANGVPLVIEVDAAATELDLTKTIGKITLQ